MNYFNLLILVSSLALTAMADAAGKRGGADGAGGDKVGPRFLEAQKTAAQIVNAISIAQVGELKLSPFFKNWLLDSGEATKDGFRAARLAKFQYYVSQMEIKFQSEACIQQGEVIRGVSFDDSDPNHPVMCVSIKLNQTISEKEAVVLIFHEAGHFTGEPNHRFLDQLGLELYGLKKSENPYICFIDRNSFGSGETYHVWKVLRRNARSEYQTPDQNILDSCREAKGAHYSSGKCIESLKASALRAESDGVCDYLKDRLYQPKEFY